MPRPQITVTLYRDARGVYEVTTDYADAEINVRVMETDEREYDPNDEIILPTYGTLTDLGAARAL